MDRALRETTLAVLGGADHMTLATIREDGYPQATTVSFAPDGLSLYFGCSPLSQKARNIARDPRVSLAVNLPYRTWSEILGVSMGGRARRLSLPEEVEHARDLLFHKFPEGVAEYASDNRGDVAFFQVMPEVISILDYRKGFGHADLVTDPGPDDLVPDRVEEADLESFPASDPPSWTGGITR